MEQNYNMTQCNYCRKETECTLEEKIVNPQPCNNTYQVYFPCQHCKNENYLWREDDILKKLIKDKEDNEKEAMNDKENIAMYINKANQLKRQIETRKKWLNKF